MISCAVSFDGEMIVSASRDKSVILWDGDGKERLKLMHDEEVWSCALSKDAQRVVTGDENGIIRVWDTATGEELNKIQGHEQGVYDLDIYGNKRLVMFSQISRCTANYLI